MQAILTIPEANIYERKITDPAIINHILAHLLTQATHTPAPQLPAIHTTTKPKTSHKRMTIDDFHKLAAAAANNTPRLAIAKELNRSSSSIKQYAQRFHLLISRQSNDLPKHLKEYIDTKPDLLAAATLIAEQYA